MFRRRRGKGDATADRAADVEADGAEDGWTPEDAGVDDAAASGTAPRPAGVAMDRSDGPFDISEVDDAEAGGRLNLGSMWLPGVPGMELRVEVDQESGQVASVTAVLEQSALQVQAFAAPRTSGIWDEVRADVAAGVAAQGGGTAEQEGPFGTELHAEIPVHLPDGTHAVQAARFLGVDGPRWFLRGVLTGEAYVDPQAAAALEAVFRGIVVVRGNEPRTRGEPLALTLPVSPAGPGGGPDAAAADALDADGGQAGGAAAVEDERPPLEPFRRGPEITEIR